jgi:hypothetical protein
MLCSLSVSDSMWRVAGTKLMSLWKLGRKRSTPKPKIAAPVRSQGIRRYDYNSCLDIIYSDYAKRQLWFLEILQTLIKFVVSA